MSEKQIISNTDLDNERNFAVKRGHPLEKLSDPDEVHKIYKKELIAKANETFYWKTQMEKEDERERKELGMYNASTAKADYAIRDGIIQAGVIVGTSVISGGISGLLMGKGIVAGIALGSGMAVDNLSSKFLGINLGIGQAMSYNMKEKDKLKKKTQAEADKINKENTAKSKRKADTIDKNLADVGITPGHPAYEKARQEAWDKYEEGI
jgi:hypothetical protein